MILRPVEQENVSKKPFIFCVWDYIIFGGRTKTNEECMKLTMLMLNKSSFKIVHKYVFLNLKWMNEWKLSSWLYVVSVSISLSGAVTKWPPHLHTTTSIISYPEFEYISDLQGAVCISVCSVFHWDALSAVTPHFQTIVERVAAFFTKKKKIKKPETDATRFGGKIKNSGKKAKGTTERDLILKKGATSQ